MITFRSFFIYASASMSGRHASVSFPKNPFMTVCTCNKIMICIYIYICIYTYIYIYIHIYTRANIICMCVCMYVCMYACKFNQAYVLCMGFLSCITYIITCTHTHKMNANLPTTCTYMHSYVHVHSDRRDVGFSHVVTR